MYQGGIVKWKESDKQAPKKAGKSSLPLMRQMQIIMGIIFMIFATLGTFINPWFLVATIAFGGSLFMAGLTGDCAVAGLLASPPGTKPAVT